MSFQLFCSSRTHRMAATVLTLAIAASVGAFAVRPAQAEPVSVVEFYHAGFNRFFMTTAPDETTKLDAGVIEGWTRTFLEFKVDSAPGDGLVPVCRFLTEKFAGKSSHFLTAFAQECAALKTDPTWIFEGIAFYAQLPSNGGLCAAETMPVYRSYNGGQDGAPAHRFTPYSGDVCYAGPGCIREGLGPDGVAFCAPVSLALAQQRTQQMSGGTWEFSYEFRGVPHVVTMSFGNAVAMYPSVLPPTYLPEAPYAAAIVSSTVGVGSAGWDPIAGKMNVVFFHTGLQFDFDGISATAGCAFDFADLDPFDGIRGPCHPATAQRR